MYRLKLTAVLAMQWFKTIKIYKEQRLSYDTKQTQHEPNRTKFISYHLEEEKKLRHTHSSHTDSFNPEMRLTHTTHTHYALV